MLEILQFIFSSFWVFVGFCFLLIVLGGMVCKVLIQLFENGPFTYEGIKRQAVKDIINKDIVYTSYINEKSNLTDKKIQMVNDIIESAKNH